MFYGNDGLLSRCTSKLTFSIAVLLVFSLYACPGWSWIADANQNMPVSTATDSQYNPRIVNDESGGALIIWQDSRNGTSNIYTQRIDSGGNRLWENGLGSGDYNGVPVSLAINNLHDPMIVSDGFSGAFITWEDHRDENYDVYVQRIDSGGKRLWENGLGSGDYNGVPVSTATNSQFNPSIINDESGGAIIIWHDSRSGASDIYAQRIDSNGNRLWENGAGTGDYEGIPISIASGDQYDFKIVSDDLGGAIIAWTDSRNGKYDIYAQRIDSNGNRLWENGAGSDNYNGIYISTATDSQYRASAVSDGLGGAIITWLKFREREQYDIYAQRIDSNGNRLWENGAGSDDYTGIPVSINSYHQLAPEIESDGFGGAIITWEDYRTGSPDIYAQRIDSVGNRLWEKGPGSGDYNGIPISMSTGNQLDPMIVSDDSGGAIITWWDERSNNSDIYAQRINSVGNRLWEKSPGSGDYNGIPISTAQDYQYPPRITRDGSGGAVIIWEDLRNADGDIYAQRICSDSSLWFSAFITPSNLSPQDMAFTSNTPTLTSSPFEDTAGESTHSSSQWQVTESSNFVDDSLQVTISGDDEYIVYTLPFTFPFFGRSITSISVNTNGLIELLEDGESCHECDDYGTHGYGDHMNNIDAVFASNDDLEMVDGYLNVYDQISHIMIEWFGSTFNDWDSTNKPIHFQVEIHPDGRIKWNFSRMDFLGSDFDMYSGVYPRGGTEIDVSYAINAQSSWAFDPVAQTVSEISFNWGIPISYILYDSGETSLDLTFHTVPSTANLSLGNTYFWSVRYKTSNGEWTLWSSPTSFTAITTENIPPIADPNGLYAAIEGQEVVLDGSGSSDADGYIVLYEWDINNNGTFDYSTTSPVQSHAFMQQGTYTIRLKVTDNLGATDEATTIVNISDTSPTVDFNGSPVNGVAPLTVHFTNNSTGYDQPLHFEWDFDNDGEVDSIAESPSYIYTASDTVSIKLTVTDADGSTNSLTQTDYIIINAQPVATAEASPGIGYAPLTVQFTGSGFDEDGSIVSYAWDFGDGTSSSEQNPVHTYAIPNIYVAQLVVTDDQGATGEDTVVVTVDFDPAAPVVTDQNPAPGETNVSTGRIISARIRDFETGVDIDSIVMRVDGDIVIPVITGSPSDYLLEYTPPGGLDSSETVSVRIYAQDFAITPNVLDETYSFVTGSGAVMTAMINFQPESSEVPVGYQVDSGNVFDVSRGYGWSKQVSTKDRDVNPDQRLDTYVYVSNTDSADWNYTVPNGTYNVTIVAGSPAYTAIHNVAVEGTVVINGVATSAGEFIEVRDYPVAVNDGQLTVTIGGTGGSRNTKLSYILIGMNDTGVPPVATAEASPGSGYAPLTVQFMGSGFDEDGSIVSYAWDFGDGTSSSEQNPVHTYPIPNIYVAQLVVTDDQGATGEDTVTVTAHPVSAEIIQVSPVAETTPVPSSGDAADDPCIWVHPTDPSQSVIIGTNKHGGIAVYNLDGTQHQYLSEGNMNNVDIRYGFSLGGDPIDLIGMSNRSNDTLAFYKMDPNTRQLSSVGSVNTNITVYGFCLYKSTVDGKVYAFVNSAGGAVRQYEIFDNNGTLAGTLSRSFSVGSITEGCVADDESESFYIAEETVGIWKYGAEPGDGMTRTSIDTVSGNLTADIEGLTIYYGTNGQGYLIASSQGASKYVIYSRASGNYVGTFLIVDGNSIDGVTGTDGIDVISTPLGSNFPFGVFVAQDNFNSSANQNFKLVRWQDIAQGFTNNLLLETSWNPRNSP